MALLDVTVVNVAVPWWSGGAAAGIPLARTVAAARAPTA